MFIINNKVFKLGERVDVADFKVGTKRMIIVGMIQKPEMDEPWFILQDVSTKEITECPPGMVFQVDEIKPRLFLALEHKGGETLEYKGLRIGEEAADIRSQFSDPEADIMVMEINEVGGHRILVKK